MNSKKRRIKTNSLNKIISPIIILTNMSSIRNYILFLSGINHFKLKVKNPVKANKKQNKQNLKYSRSCSNVESRVRLYYHNTRISHEKYGRFRM